MQTGQIAIVAGTPQPFTGGSQVNGGFLIRALSTNSGAITIGCPPAGGSISSLANGSGNGYILLAGESVQIGRENGANFQANGTVSGDVLTWISY